MNGQSARIVRDGGVYRISGPITMDNVEGLLQEGRRLFQDGQVTVDLAAVEEADSSALSLLLQWMRDGSGQGRRMLFANLPTGLQSLAGLYGIDDLFASPTATND
ncbi:MAG: STAS domain-containing protein [Burkholderiales bacterium]|nr:STAS domain-containing protein [Burkholderiales bacterium]